MIILGGCIIFAGSEHKDEVLYKDGQRSVSTKNNNIIFPNDSVSLESNDVYEVDSPDDEPDYFQDHWEEWNADPEDEIEYSPLIFDASEDWFA